jgi:hypothetical protein
MLFNLPRHQSLFNKIHSHVFVVLATKYCQTAAVTFAVSVYASVKLAACNLSRTESTGAVITTTT